MVMDLRGNNFFDFTVLRNDNILAIDDQAVRYSKDHCYS